MKFEDSIVKEVEKPSINYVQTLDPSETNIVSQKNTHKIHDPNDPVNLLNSIVSSREAVRTSANAKLATIGQQMDFLVEQAKKVMMKCKRDEKLHQAACNFQKKPGTTYYLYKKPSGQEYFSMLSPEDWGKSLKSEYLGAYKLECDHSFTLMDRIDDIDDEATQKYRRLAERICF